MPCKSPAAVDAAARWANDADAIGHALADHLHETSDARTNRPREQCSYRMWPPNGQPVFNPVVHQTVLSVKVHRKIVQRGDSPLARSAAEMRCTSVFAASSTSLHRRTSAAPRRYC